MEWNRENIETLVNAYRLRGELWDPKDVNYHVKNKKADAWREVASEVGCDVGEAKTKMTSLLSSFRREKAKEKKSQNATGSGRAQLHVSTWFAYKLFSFLMEKDVPSNTLDTESVTIEEPANSPGDDDEEEFNELQPGVPTANQNTETTSPAATSSQRTFVPPQSKRKRQRMGRMSIDEPRLAQAYRILDNAEKTTRDECSTFGEHIATKLRKFDDRCRNYLMHRITTLIYETEMEIDIRSPQQLAGSSSRSQSSSPALRNNQLYIPQFENNSSTNTISTLQSPSSHRSTSRMEEYQPPSEPRLLQVLTTPDNPLQSFLNNFQENNEDVMTNLYPSNASNVLPK